jgi:nitrite reductase/ring-hydroxylating ferredoxin subunit
MLLGAYLGGHLVFGEQIGVNHATQTELPTEFAPVMRDEELPENEPRRVQYNGLPVVLVRERSRVYALYERCSHMSGPLAEGKIEGNAIRCPWHGSCFSLEDGSVLEGPATNPQPSFEVRIADGQIYLRSREPESP